MTVCISYEPDFRHFLNATADWKTPSSTVSIDGVRNDVRQHLARLDKLCEARSWLRPQREWAQYALIALVDEVLLGRGDPMSQAWSQSPLQLERFGEFTAGQGFFVRLRALEQADAPDLPLLRLYYLCLQYGFRGELAIAPEADRRFVLERARQFLVSHDGLSAARLPLSGHPAGQPEPARWHDRFRRIFFRTGSSDA